jgi:Secretion system C-terminal sorting domain
VQDTIVFDSMLNAITLQNEAVNGTEYFITQEKLMNSMYLSLIDGQTLAAQQVLAVEALANNCPYIAGNATYKARALLQAYGIAHTYDDRALCNSQGVFRNAAIAKPAGNSATQISMYPNPTTGQLHIQCSDLTAEYALAQVYAATGALVLQANIRFINGFASLDLSDLVSGAYTVKIYNQKQAQVYTHRIVKW